MIIINTKTGEIKQSDLETDKKNVTPQSYEMPDMSKYDEPKKSKGGRKTSGKPKQKLTPVKELKTEVYASLNLAEGDTDNVKKLVGYSFFNTDTQKFDSLVKRSTWETIITALRDDNHGTLSNDWLETYETLTAKKKPTGKAYKHLGKTEKTKTVTGEATLKSLKQTVYELLGVTDTPSAKEKAKELGIDIKDLSLRSKLGWESFRKRTVKKLTPPVEESPIVSVDKQSHSSTTESVVVTEKATSEIVENDLDTAQSLEASFASHWSRNRSKVYEALKSQKKSTRETQSIIRMLQQCKKDLEVQDFDDVLEVNGLTQFMYKAS